MLGERPKALELGGMSLGFMGVVVLGMGSFAWSSPRAMLIWLAPLGWALGSIPSRPIAASAWRLMVAGAQMISGGIAMVIASAVLGERIPLLSTAGAERYRGRIDIPQSSELAIAWSMPRLFGGRSPALGPWQELPGLSLAAQEMPGRPDWFFVDHGAVAWFEGPKLRTLLGGVITFVPGKDLGGVAPGPIAALSPSLFAWASGEKVLYRTPRGISAEALPTYVLAPGTSTSPFPPPGPPYPCYATGIAIPSESELVVVGRCRGNSPESDKVPQEGFIVERDRERWRRLPERPPPLRAMASDGHVVVAVGDDGTVMWRRRGKWTRAKSTTAKSGLAFVEVGLVDGRAFARTKQGDLFDLASMASPVPTFDEPRPGSGFIVKRRSRQMCLTRHGPVAWFGRETFLDSGAARLPDRIALWEGVRWRTVFSGGERGTNVVALACDGDTIWLVTSDAQKPVSVRTISAASATATGTIVW